MASAMHSIPVTEPQYGSNLANPWKQSRQLIKAKMSGHPQQAQYDDGYGHHQTGNTDSYYQDEHNQAYYDNNNGGHSEHPGHAQGADGYYDES
jgi:hypothetical protein